jgi:hypothetical protein
MFEIVCDDSNIAVICTSKTLEQTRSKQMGKPDISWPVRSAASPVKAQVRAGCAVRDLNPEPAD